MGVGFRRGGVRPRFVRGAGSRAATPVAAAKANANQPVGSAPAAVRTPHTVSSAATATSAVSNLRHVIPHPLRRTLYPSVTATAALSAERHSTVAKRCGTRHQNRGLICDNGTKGGANHPLDNKGQPPLAAPNQVVHHGDMATEEELRHIATITEQLVKQHPEIPRATGEDEVRKAHQSFTDNPIRDFVPVFVERRVKDALHVHLTPAVR
jgi:hypothetical protein